MTGAPPSEAGATQVSEALALPAVATTSVGALGAMTTLVGVTEFDGVDAVPVPARWWPPQ